MSTVRAMTLVRRAEPEDATEVLRLRQVMIDSVPGADTSTHWQTQALPTLRAKLAEQDGDFVAYVVDHPGRPGALAALAAGTIEYRIGRAGNPHGTVGHVFSVATDPDARRRGYARVHGNAARLVPQARRRPGAAHRVRRGRTAVHLPGLPAQARPVAGAVAVSA